MTTVQEPPLTLGDSSARQLANATKTTAQMTTITPRWLVHLLPWQPVEAGIYRLNKVWHPESVDIALWGAGTPEEHGRALGEWEGPARYFEGSALLWRRCTQPPCVMEAHRQAQPPVSLVAFCRTIPWWES